MVLTRLADASTLYFKNLETGELYEDEIPETNGGVVWANDNKTIFYTKNDPQTLRSYRVYKHVLGTRKLGCSCL